VTARARSNQRRDSLSAVEFAGVSAVTPPV